MAGGRPSKFDKLWEQHQDKLAKLYSAGLTDKEVAELLEITDRTIENWKVKHTEFFQALKLWKEGADSRVEKSLYERACGYSHLDTDIRVIQNKIVKTDIVKHYPPDATSMIFWLKNRQPDKWREKQDIGFGENDLESVHISFNRKEKTDK